MSCFNCNTGDNWWIIILLVILCCCDNDSGILRCLRDLVCGDNLIWIIALLLLCNTNGCDDRRMGPVNPCGCCN